MASPMVAAKRHAAGSETERPASAAPRNTRLADSAQYRLVASTTCSTLASMSRRREAWLRKAPRGGVGDETAGLPPGARGARRSAGMAPLDAARLQRIAAIPDDGLKRRRQLRW